MRKLFKVLMVFLVLGALRQAHGDMAAMAQTTVPAESDVTVKRVVKVGDKWYVETNRTTKTYQELTPDMLLEVQKEDQELAADDAEKKRVADEAAKKKLERAERNKLLKDALKKGYVPEVRTLEEQEKIDKIKKKLGV